VSDRPEDPRHGGSPDPEEEQLTVLDIVRTVWRRRGFIVLLVLVCVVATFGISRLSSKVYEATATIVTPKEVPSGVLSGLAASGLLQSTPGLAIGAMPSFTPNRDLLIGVLKSRTIAQAIVERFDLRTRYRTRYLDDTIARLRAATTIAVSREGVISIRVEDWDAATSAAMANLYIELLDQLVARYGTGEAGRQRTFLTGQLARARVDLDVTEQGMRRFQEQNRAIVLQDQTKGAIEAAARLKGEIMAAEVQLQVMRNFATEANPEIVALRRRIDEMNRQLGKMQYGDDMPRANNKRDRADFAVPFVRVPEIGLELARLTREVKVQEVLVTLLTQQLEQARIGEAKDTPVVQLLDRAVPGEREVRPRPMRNAAIAGITSLIAAMLLAFVLESFDRRRGIART
jgi:capsule polysaccharide export protein KpsE/RkpR